MRTDNHTIKAIELYLGLDVHKDSITIAIASFPLRLLRGVLAASSCPVEGPTLAKSVAALNFRVCETRLPFIPHPGFNQIEEIGQVFQFLAQRGNLFALPAKGANHGSLSGLSHKHLCDGRFCE